MCTRFSGYCSVNIQEYYVEAIQQIYWPKQVLRKGINFTMVVALCGGEHSEDFLLSPRHLYQAIFTFSCHLVFINFLHFHNFSLFPYLYFIFFFHCTTSISPNFRLNSIIIGLKVFYFKILWMTHHNRRRNRLEFQPNFAALKEQIGTRLLPGSSLGQL